MLRVADLVGDPATIVVVVQVIATCAAGVGLLRLGRHLAGPVAGVVAAGALLVNPMTAQWTRFVLTEPLFYATAVGVVVVAVQEHPRRRVTLTALAVSALLLRPTGPLLAGAATLLALTATQDPPAARRGRALIVGAATTAVLAAGVVATGPPAEGTFDEQLRAGVVVEGTPEVRTSIPMPAGVGTAGVTRYLAEHPLAVARLGVTRVVVEVAQVRRHYPPVVNLMLAVAMLGFAALAAIGLRDPRGRPLRRPAALVAVPLIAITAVTFAVPEGRYGWAGLVALLPAVGVGAQHVLERIRPQTDGGNAR